MISMIAPLYIGNALRLWIEPPATAVRWRILRKTSNSFSGPDDTSALIAYEGSDRSFVDSTALTNSVEVWYAPFWTSDGTTWHAEAQAYATPSATYEETTTDAQALVRERIEAGLLVEVQRGNFLHDLGHIQVLQAAPSMEGDLRFPLVTVHLDYEEPADRFLGEGIIGGLDTETMLDDSDGWLSNVGLTLVGWTLNADERAELRRALRRIILGNLQVFSDKGLEQVSVKFQDVDAISGEYGAPVYQVMANFTCLAPVRVGAPVDAFTGDITTALETLNG
jgi:hypothetical protein